VELARKAGLPLSKFIIQVVEDALVKESEFKSRGELTKEIEKLRADNKQIRDELKLKNIVLDKYATELKRYRGEVILKDEFEGVRKYNKEIIAILKRGGIIDSYALLDQLGIDFKDSDIVKAVSRQLEEFESYGLIISSSRGWKWIVD
jgi:hypothetical protein